jgi:hypothetical protein
MKGVVKVVIADTATITGYRKLLVTFMDIPKVAIIRRILQFVLNSFPFVWIVLKVVLKLKHQ